MSNKPHLHRIIFLSILLTSSILCQSPATGDVVSSTAGSLSNAISDIGNASATAIANANTHNVHLINIDSTSSSDPILTGNNFVDQVFPSAASIGIVMPNIAVVPTSISGSSIVVGNCETMKWTSTKRQAIDIAVSSQGDLYSVGLDRQLYQYNFLTNTWAAITSEEDDINNIIKVTVSYDGTPFIATASGETYYNNCNREWMRLPGCALDLSIGRGGEIYKIGCELKGSGYSIYKLFCRGNDKDDDDDDDNAQLHFNFNSETCNRSQRLWKCHGCNKKKEERRCEWFKISGAGLRIAVKSDGSPVIIDIKGDILSYENDDWMPLVTGANARDVDVSNENEIFYTDTSSHMFKLSRKTIAYGQYIPIPICGVAQSMTVGAYGHPFIIGSDYTVYSSSKHCFN